MRCVVVRCSAQVSTLKIRWPQGHAGFDPWPGLDSKSLHYSKAGDVAGAQVSGCRVTTTVCETIALSTLTGRKALNRAAFLGAGETTFQLCDTGVMPPAERPTHIERSKRAASYEASRPNASRLRHTVPDRVSDNFPANPSVLRLPPG